MLRMPRRVEGLEVHLRVAIYFLVGGGGIVTASSQKLYGDRANRPPAFGLPPS